MVFGEVQRAVKAGLERHSQYCEHVHGEAVDPRMLIPEILRVFLDPHRKFQSWSRSGGTQQPCRVSTPSSSNGSTKAPAWVE